MANKKDLLSTTSDSRRLISLSSLPWNGMEIVTHSLDSNQNAGIKRNENKLNRTGERDQRIELPSEIVSIFPTKCRFKVSSKSCLFLREPF